MSTVALCTLILNEMEWLPYLYEQHRAWPGLIKWVFVESADRAYAEINPDMVTDDGLSVDGTTEYLSRISLNDSMIVHIRHGLSNHSDLAQGKCEARSRYLEAVNDVSPNFVFVLDADEFYTRENQDRIMEWMEKSRGTGFCFKHRHPWRPPSLKDRSAFSLEVVGGFWDIPLCRGWKWQRGLRYHQNHNTPETQDGTLLDTRLERFFRTPKSPECVHMAFASSLKFREAKHRYYAHRGEGRVDHRGWYVQSRAAWESWKPGDILPRNASVIRYTGGIPECFLER